MAGAGAAQHHAEDSEEDGEEGGEHGAGGVAGAGVLAQQAARSLPEVAAHAAAAMAARDPHARGPPGYASCAPPRPTPGAVAASPGLVPMHQGGAVVGAHMCMPGPQYGMPPNAHQMAMEHAMPGAAMQPMVPMMPPGGAGASPLSPLGQSQMLGQPMMAAPGQMPPGAMMQPGIVSPHGWPISPAQQQPGMVLVQPGQVNPLSPVSPLAGGVAAGHAGVPSSGLSPIGQMAPPLGHQPRMAPPQMLRMQPTAGMEFKRPLAPALDGGGSLGMPPRRKPRNHKNLSVATPMRLPVEANGMPQPHAAGQPPISAPPDGDQRWHSAGSGWAGDGAPPPHGPPHGGGPLGPGSPLDVLAHASSDQPAAALGMPVEPPPPGVTETRA